MRTIVIYILGPIMMCLSVVIAAKEVKPLEFDPEFLEVWEGKISKDDGGTYQRCLNGWKIDQRVKKSREAFLHLIGNTESYDKYLLLEVAGENISSHIGYFIGQKNDTFWLVRKEASVINFQEIKNIQKQLKFRKVIESLNKVANLGGLDSIPKKGLTHATCSFLVSGGQSSDFIYATINISYLIQLDIAQKPNEGDLSSKQNLLYDFVSIF